jgi:hypothetical protein
MKKKKSLSAWFRQRSSLLSVTRHRFTEKHFDAHVKAIGSLLLAWHDLHERLCSLFVMSMGVAQFARTYAIWHETNRDYAKRKAAEVAARVVGAIGATGGVPFARMHTRYILGST